MAVVLLLSCLGGCVPIQIIENPTSLCTVIFKNNTSGTTVRRISVYYTGSPITPLKYLDVNIGPGQSYSFDAYADKGDLYLCPSRGVGYGCLADLYVYNPQAGGVYEVTLSDKNCGSCG